MAPRPTVETCCLMGPILQPGDFENIRADLLGLLGTFENCVKWMSWVFDVTPLDSRRVSG